MCGHSRPLPARRQLAAALFDVLKLLYLPLLAVAALAAGVLKLLYLQLLAAAAAADVLMPPYLVLLAVAYTATLAHRQQQQAVADAAAWIYSIGRCACILVV